MRRAFIVAAVVIGCAVSPPSLIAGDRAVTESFDLQPYAVTGATAADLRTAIRAARPATADGARFDAITRWHVSYRYDFARDATGGCAPANLRVKLELKIEMPALAEDVPPQTRAALEAYLDALRAHEEGHARIDRGIATAVADAVAASCAIPAFFAPTPDHIIAGSDCFEQPWNLLRRILQVSVQRHHHVAAGISKPREQRRMLSKVARQLDHPDARVRLAIFTQNFQ